MQAQATKAVTFASQDSGFQAPSGKAPKVKLKAKPQGKSSLKGPPPQHVHVYEGSAGRGTVQIDTRSKAVQELFSGVLSLTPSSTSSALSKSPAQRKEIQVGRPSGVPSFKEYRGYESDRGFIASEAAKIITPPKAKTQAPTLDDEDDGFHPYNTPEQTEQTG